VRRPRVGLFECRKHQHAGDHACEPVEISAARHRVEMRGEDDFLGVRLRSERDGKIADRVPLSGQAVAAAERNQNFTRRRFLRAERVAGDAVYISGCRAHLIEQRGGRGAHEIDCGVDVRHWRTFVAAGRNE